MARKISLTARALSYPRLPATTMIRVTMWTGKGTCWPNMSPKC